MTDLYDLYDTPQERLAAVFQDFAERLQAEHDKKEAALDHVFEHARTRLHRVHLKAQNSYKRIFDEILVKLNHHDDVEILHFFEKVIRSRRKDLYADVFARAEPAISTVEKEGGNLRIDIEKEGYGGGNCIYSDRRKGYFSFLDVFLDGFDDDWGYKVVKQRVNHEEERNIRSEAAVRAWKKEEENRRVTVEKATAAVEATGLKEVDLVTVIKGFLEEHRGSEAATESASIEKEKEEDSISPTQAPPAESATATAAEKGYGYFS